MTRLVKTRSDKTGLAATAPGVDTPVAATVFHTVSGPLLSPMIAAAAMYCRSVSVTGNVLHLRSAGI